MSAETFLHSKGKVPLRGGVHSSCRGLRRPAVCHAEARDTAVSSTAPRSRNGSMIRSLAAAVELSGQVQRYETFAGRSAMVGVAAAAGIEVVTDHSIFLAVNGDTALTYAAVALATMAVAAVAALARSRSGATAAGSDVDLLEAVYASLTAVRRSAASVTQTQVDTAVDYQLETVLESSFESFSIDGLLTNIDDEN